MVQMHYSQENHIAIVQKKTVNKSYYNKLPLPGLEAGLWWLYKAADRMRIPLLETDGQVLSHQKFVCCDTV